MQSAYADSINHGVDEDRVQKADSATYNGFVAVVRFAQLFLLLKRLDSVKKYYVFVGKVGE